jgi:DNA repair protein RadC
MNNKSQKWHHPGGKLLSILIAPGIPGKPAEKIAREILQKFGGFKGMAEKC